MSPNKSLVFAAESPPLTTNQDGVVLVSETRVTLDTVVNVFKHGATAEEIVYRYPALSLADVYAVISYYLKHQASVETYLLRRHQQAEVIRQENEQRSDVQAIRERLLARKRESEQC